VAVPGWGWGFGVRKAVEIKTIPKRVHYKIGPNSYPEGQKLKHLLGFSVFGGINDFSDTIIRLFGRNIDQSFLGGTQ